MTCILTLYDLLHVLQTLHLFSHLPTCNYVSLAKAMGQSVTSMCRITNYFNFYIWKPELIIILFQSHSCLTVNDVTLITSDHVDQIAKPRCCPQHFIPV